MGNLLETMQQITEVQLAGYGLSDYRLGLVTGVNSLKIKINDQIILDEAKGQLILTEQVLKKQLDLAHVHQVLGETEVMDAHIHPIDFDSQKELTTKITINEGLQVGDGVLLLSVSRGQIYLILSKVRAKSSVLIDKHDHWKWS